MSALDHAQHSLFNFVLAHQQEIVEAFPQYLLWQFKGDAGRQALSEGAIGGGDQASLSPRFVGRGSCFGLHSDDLNSRVYGMGGNTHASRAASAANGHEDHVQFRLVFQHFQPFGSYSCNE